jgi:hypothetical protein
MKTTMQMFAALCSLALLAGCAAPGDGISEEDETLGDDASGEVASDAVGSDEEVGSVEQALCTYNYPSDTGVGERTSSTGCFKWGDTLIGYSSKGAVNNSGSMGSFTTLAKSGDFEILSLGSSLGGNDKTGIDTYFDKAKMEGQKFQAIGVRGSDDKKIEMWVRKNTGQTSISLPSKAKAYNLLALKGADVQLNLGTITKNTVQSSSSSSFTVPSLSDATRLNVVSYYGDDPFEVLDTKGGQLIFNKWGFGDEDSLNVVFYEPYDTPPSSISVKDYDPVGKQYVGLRAHFRRL